MSMDETPPSRGLGQAADAVAAAWRAVQAANRALLTAGLALIEAHTVLRDERDAQTFEQLEAEARLLTSPRPHVPRTVPRQWVEREARRRAEEEKTDGDLG